MNERSSMNERQRVEALLGEGKISEEEASLLLEALDEAETAEAMADEEALGAAPPPQGASPAAPPPPSASPPPPQPPGPSRGAQPPLRWLRIGMMAKNLEVRREEGLAEPRVEGADLGRQGEDWAVQAQGIESLLSGRNSLKIAVPPDCGVDLSAKAGNIEISGVAFVRGRVVAGNVELEEVEGLDLELKAGNLDATLRLVEGEHRVQVSMGNADIALLRGSSVKLSSKVSMGAIDIDGPIKMGEGRASLDLLVKMGNLDIKVPRA